MDPTEAATALTQASQASTRARTAGRWYARYLVLYAVACFVLAVAIGASGGFPGVVVVSLLFAAAVVALSHWARSHPAVMRGMTGLHLTVVFSSMAVWAVTVFLGTAFFTGQLGWWLGGGLAMAAPALTGAAIAFRRTAA